MKLLQKLVPGCIKFLGCWFTLLRALLRAKRNEELVQSREGSLQNSDVRSEIQDAIRSEIQDAISGHGMPSSYAQAILYNIAFFISSRWWESQLMMDKCVSRNVIEVFCDSYHIRHK